MEKYKEIVVEMICDISVKEMIRRKKTKDGYISNSITDIFKKTCSNMTEAKKVVWKREIFDYILKDYNQKRLYYGLNCNDDVLSIINDWIYMMAISNQTMIWHRYTEEEKLIT